MFRGRLFARVEFVAASRVVLATVSLHCGTEVVAVFSDRGSPLSMRASALLRQPSARMVVALGLALVASIWCVVSALNDGMLNLARVRLVGM